MLLSFIFLSLPLFLEEKDKKRKDLLWLYFLEQFWRHRSSQCYSSFQEKGKSKRYRENLMDKKDPFLRLNIFISYFFFWAKIIVPSLIYFIWFWNLYQLVKNVLIPPMFNYFHLLFKISLLIKWKLNEIPKRWRGGGVWG